MIKVNIKDSKDKLTHSGLFRDMAESNAWISKHEEKERPWGYEPGDYVKEIVNFNSSTDAEAVEFRKQESDRVNRNAKIERVKANAGAKIDNSSLDDDIKDLLKLLIKQLR